MIRPLLLVLMCAPVVSWAQDSKPVDDPTSRWTMETVDGRRFGGVAIRSLLGDTLFYAAPSDRSIALGNIDNLSRVDGTKFWQGALIGGLVAGLATFAVFEASSPEALWKQRLQVELSLAAFGLGAIIGAGVGLSTDNVEIIEMSAMTDEERELAVERILENDRNAVAARAASDSARAARSSRR
jgi:hypothetical protein